MFMIRDAASYRVTVGIRVHPNEKEGDNTSAQCIFSEKYLDTNQYRMQQNICYTELKNFQ